MRTANQIYSEVGLCFALAAWIGLRINVWVGLFLASAALACISPMYDFISVVALLQWVLVAAWYSIVFMTDDINVILDGICLLALVQFAVCVTQLFGADFINGYGYSSMCYGLFTNPNEAAALFSISFPAFWRHSRPYIKLRGKQWEFPVSWALLSPFMIFGLLMTKSFGAVLAVTAAGLCGLYMVLDPKDRWVIVILLIGPVVYLAVDAPEVQGLRFSAWVAAWKIVIQRPLTGIGLGHWASTFPLGSGGIWWDSAHNDYIQTVYEHGFRAVPIMIGYIIALFWRALYIDKNILLISACIACLVSASFHWLFQQGTTCVVGVAYFAMLDGNNFRNRRKQDGR